MSDLNALIEQSTAQTIQSQVRRSPQSGVGVVWWMARAGLTIPQWWSPARDRELRSFWKKSDHLAGAIYAMTAKMSAIPFQVIARDQSVKKHVDQAKRINNALQGGAQFGDGWGTFFARFVEDMLTTDNGAFAEIIGPGDPSGPLTGPPITIAHLDSFRCNRTGNAEFPVVYQDTDGRQYKLHYSRVIFISQMTSPIAEMFGVGFCSVSRCVNVSQTLVDILTYKQEKLGSRPHRAILITRGGLDPNDVQEAFQLAESNMDTQGLSRYSKVVVAGSASLQDAGLDMIELASLPEGFNEETSITLGMATIALALGVDARELFPSMGSGATRADALLQHLKQRGKGPGMIIQAVEQAFNFKYLPSHLQMVFDFQDDAQDRQRADIWLVHSNRRVQDLKSGALTKRMVREQMLDVGDLTRSQFERLELADGRTPDGATILALFFSEDPLLQTYLDLGISNVLDVKGNNPEAIIELVREKLSEVAAAMVKETNEVKWFAAYQSMMALIYLQKYYEDPSVIVTTILGDSPPGNLPYQDPRARQRNPGEINQQEEMQPDQNDQNFTEDQDDKE